MDKLDETNDVKEMIFDLMMADFDDHGIMQITRETMYGITDYLVELAKARKQIKGLKTDIEIITKDVNYRNCNTCLKACEYRPLPGEQVRSNCFRWVGKSGEQE